MTNETADRLRRMGIDTPARMGIEGEGMEIAEIKALHAENGLGESLEDDIIINWLIAEAERLTAANIELTERARYAEKEHNFPAGFAWCGKHGYFSAAVEDTDCPACAAESEAAALRAELAQANERAERAEKDTEFSDDEIFRLRAELARKDKALEWVHRKFYRACPRGWMAEVYDKINEVLFNGDLGKEMAVVQSYEQDAAKETPHG